MCNLKKEEQMLLEVVNSLLENKSCAGVIDQYSNIDWEYFYSICEKNRVQFWVLNRMREYIPLSLKERVQKDYRSFVVEVDLYMRELEDVVKLSNELEIPILCVKGLPMAYQLYDDLYVRPFGDIDIIVPMQSILKFRNELLKDHEQMNKGMFSNEEYLDFVGIFHEFWLRKMIEGQEVHIEIKETSSAIERRFVEDFMKNSTVIKIGNLSVTVPDKIHTFLHLCANTFENFETMNGVLRHIMMRDMLDVQVFLMKYKHDMDWDKVLFFSNKYEITHRIYCVLTYINELFDVKISQKILDMFTVEGISYKLCYCNSKGGKVNWTNTVAERLFLGTEEKAKLYLKMVYEREISNINKNIKYILNDKTDMNKSGNMSSLEISSVKQQIVRWCLRKIDDKLAVDILLDNNLFEENSFFYQMIFFVHSEMRTLWVRNIENSYKYGFRYDTDDRKIDYLKNSEIIESNSKKIIRCYLDVNQGPFYKASRKGIGCNVLVHLQEGNCSLPILVKYSDKSNPEEYLDNVEIWKEGNSEGNNENDYKM